MEQTPPVFKCIDMRRLLEKTAISRVAWCLGMSEEGVRQWTVIMPALESQYVRESFGCRHKANRRLIMKSTAIALFDEGIAGLDTWLSQVKAASDLYDSTRYLTEYQSLLIEYATKGAVRGASIIHKLPSISENKIL